MILHTLCYTLLACRYCRHTDWMRKWHKSTLGVVGCNSVDTGPVMLKPNKMHVNDMLHCCTSYWLFNIFILGVTTDEVPEGEVGECPLVDLSGRVLLWLCLECVCVWMCWWVVVWVESRMGMGGSVLSRRRGMVEMKWGGDVCVEYWWECFSE